MGVKVEYPYPHWIEQGLDLLEHREPYSEELRAAIDEIETRFAAEEVELVSIEHQVWCAKNAFEEGYDAGFKAASLAVEGNT